MPGPISSSRTFFPYFPESFFQKGSSWQFFGAEPEERTWLLACTEAFSQQLMEALESVSQELSNRLGLAVQMEGKPSFIPFLAALRRNFSGQR